LIIVNVTTVTPSPYTITGPTFLSSTAVSGVLLTDCVAGPICTQYWQISYQIADGACSFSFPTYMFGDLGCTSTPSNCPYAGVVQLVWQLSVGGDDFCAITYTSEELAAVSMASDIGAYTDINNTDTTTEYNAGDISYWSVYVVSEPPAVDAQPISIIICRVNPNVATGLANGCSSDQAEYVTTISNGVWGNFTSSAIPFHFPLDAATFTEGFYEINALMSVNRYTAILTEEQLQWIENTTLASTVFFVRNTATTGTGSSSEGGLPFWWWYAVVAGAGLLLIIIIIIVIAVVAKKKAKGRSHSLPAEHHEMTAMDK